MKTILKLLIIGIPLLYSCGQEEKAKSNQTIPVKKVSKNTENIESRKIVTISNDKYLDTRFEYSDSNDKNLIIKNSLPKGGQIFTDAKGIEYVYAVFWTQISNKTDRPFELALEFAPDSFQLPTSPDNFFKLFIPNEEMTIIKESLPNYGLSDLNTILDNKLQKSSLLQRTIYANRASSFYVVTLFKKGVEGNVRAGLSIKDDKFYYKVNDKEILCGQFNIKGLKPI